ncbi:MAG TPA: FAD-dependent oxidoreductase, partial [Pyrinomonadaceae bacterium]|nr:FAD-dependent oxidoreductase [Pyrinomonadaceae bacterium]
YAALYSYWLLGAARRRRPRCRKDFAELDFLNRERFPYSLEYEEASVAPSDARFVLEWVLPRPFQQDEQVALNYCNFQNAHYDRAAREWRLEIADSILQAETTATAKWIVNAAGTWTDCLNRRLNIESPYKHAFGKGVFIGIKRPPGHFSSLMIETRERDGCLALIPWGPVALWGPTETRVADAKEGFSVEPEDVRFLLRQLNRHLARPVSIEEIVSLRCGVRPIVVNRSFSETRHTAGVPREYRVHRDGARPWISVYGGKLTSSILLAESVAALLRDCPPSKVKSPNSTAFDQSPPSPELKSFPGLDEKIPSARWCAEKEMCWNLEDYLRRRTNVSQWIGRGGLGFQNENSEYLAGLAAVFQPAGDETGAKAAARAYEQKIRREFDRVLASAA